MVWGKYLRKKGALFSGNPS